MSYLSDEAVYRTAPAIWVCYLLFKENPYSEKGKIYYINLIGGFCMVAELASGGFATNKATPFTFFIPRGCRNKIATPGDSSCVIGEVGCMI